MTGLEAHSRSSAGRRPTRWPVVAFLCLAVLGLPLVPQLGAAPAGAQQDGQQDAQLDAVPPGGASATSADGIGSADDDPLLRALEGDGRDDAALGRHAARALVEPRAEAVLSSEIGGRIVELPFDEGEAFEAGDVLAAFDCSFHRADLAGARADLTKARRTLENKRQLAELNSVGALEVALAEADVAKAEAQVRSRALVVERCRVHAPFDGRVVDRPVNAYESVGKDRELMSVIATGAPKVRLIVPSRWLAWLAPGTRFELTIDETGRTHPAVVETIGARIDPVSQTVPIEGRFTGKAAGGGGGDAEGAGLIPGMSGTARFEPGQG